jgi:hypothetical protein
LQLVTTSSYRAKSGPQWLAEVSQKSTPIDSSESRRFGLLHCGDTQASNIDS